MSNCNLSGGINVFFDMEYCEKHFRFHENDCIDCLSELRNKKLNKILNIIEVEEPKLSNRIDDNPNPMKDFVNKKMGYKGWKK